MSIQTLVEQARSAASMPRQMGDPAYTSINALLASYGSNVPLLPTAGPPSGGWPHTDYDTVWTVKLDAQGNATSVTPSTDTLEAATIAALNAGQASFCLEVISPVGGAVVVGEVLLNAGL